MSEGVKSLVGQRETNWGGVAAFGTALVIGAGLMAIELVGREFQISRLKMVTASGVWTALAVGSYTWLMRKGSPSSTQPPVLPKSNLKGEVPSSPKTKICLEEEVPIFVRIFLSPYLTGRITAENEDKNRKGLMTLLIEKFSPDSETAKQQLQEMAFNAYIEQSVVGLGLGRGDHAREDEVAGLAQAIERALPTDFPGLSLSTSELLQRVRQGFEAVDRLRDPR